MFRASRPTIDIELSLSKLNQDLTRHDADIAICMAIPTQSTLVARKLGDVTVGLYADRAYLDRHRTPQTFSDLVRHTLISFDADAGGIRARRQAGVSITRELFAFRSDSDRAQLSHPRVRFGIAGHQKGGAARDPRLVAVLAERVRLCACDVAMPICAPAVAYDCSSITWHRHSKPMLPSPPERLRSGVDSKGAMSYIRPPFVGESPNEKGDDAGWSSPVARQAHNLKVIGSNPIPATNLELNQ